MVKNKIGIGILFLATLLVGMALMPAASAQKESSNVTYSLGMISEKQAEEVASYSIKEISGSVPNFEDWEDATVKLSTVYYDLDGKISAYSYNIIENKQQAGYIFISATKDNYPVLEFSKGKIPNEIPEYTTRSKSLAQERANKIKLESNDKEELTIGRMKPLYLGPTFYYAEYALIDTEGKAKEKVIVDLPFSTIVDFNKSNVSIPVNEEDCLFNNTYLQQQQEIRTQNSNIQWTVLEKEMANSSSYSTSSSSKTISGVPKYGWLCGCSPTASGMVLGYWASHGYSYLITGPDLVRELATAMGTEWPGNGATWPWAIDDGIETVCNNHGYNNFDASNDIYVSWSEVKTEVNADKPFVLSMLNGGTGNGYTQPYGDHSVTCVGYYDGSSDYVYIHDTWDTSNKHYLTFGSWTGAMATWVRP
ncbi:C39 family peptidase [Methanosarcina sp.]|jgi:hypothetical protein|uniref:C39 family peptidase n=1 Tax=Methanosarcina sp. TaxID=2213 RepID=UPI002C0697CE|nr:C39 family peptidase [Methanosarcina sp.]HOW15743.1 C39 family peptidase [Methanosarcina sp.]